MTSSNLLSALTCGLFLLGSSGAAEFKEFAPAGGGYKVRLPGTPIEETQETPVGKVTTYGAETDDAYFAVSSNELPFPVERLARDAEKVLDGARRGLLESVKGKLLEERKITLDGKHLGREFRAEIKLPDRQGATRVRIYLVEKRLIQLMVVGQAEALTSPDVDKFLSSLTLTK